MLGTLHISAHNITQQNGRTLGETVRQQHIQGVRSIVKRVLWTQRGREILKGKIWLRCYATRLPFGIPNWKMISLKYNTGSKKCEFTVATKMSGY